MTTPAEARLTLVKAQSDPKAAKDKLEMAQKATTAARAFMGKSEGELDQLRATDTHVAGARAIDIVQALKEGRSPEIKALPGLQKTAAARAECENRSQAAQRALQQLAEERLAEGDHSAAEVRLADTIKAVLIAEADEMSVRVRCLQAEALALRLNLGLESGFIARLAPGRFTLAPELETNSQPFLTARASSARWANFAKALAADVDAQLEF
jgi:hypothetical protein